MRKASWLAIPLAMALAAAPPARPKLVVVVSVDQLSAELMSRWAKDLPGGLGRLWRDGAVFQDAYHDHAATETGPGHSVLLTGRHPWHTGIPANDWPDAQGHAVYCVADPAGKLIGAAGTPVGPANLTASTLGEWLTGQIPGSRSFALAGKDRAAILMAGHRAQGVYWFAGAAGFTGSEAYAATLPAWLQTYNHGLLARISDESLFWNALDPVGLPPAASYSVHGQTLVMGLPRAVHGIGMPLDGAFWTRFKGTPFFDEATLGAAEALAEGEHLGRGPGVDLLALGLSATDYIGHRYGNGGPEMLDNLRRLDRALGTFLDHLQARAPGFWVVLTADHGCADFPERLQAQGIPARRVFLRAWADAFNQALTQRLGGTRPYFRVGPDHQLHLDPAALQAGGPARAELLAAAVAVAKASPDIAEACSGDDLAAFTPDPDQAPDQRSLRARLRLSFVPGRSGDLLLAFQPLCVLDDPGEVASHGSPHDYDRRVPLIFWGPWRAERRTGPVRTVDLAPTLARELGLASANPVDGRPLDLPRRP